jgi:hypothetical protein
MTQVIVTMQNGEIETIDYPTAKAKSIMRIRVAYYIVCMYPNWRYVNWDWEGKLQILKRGESK